MDDAGQDERSCKDGVEQVERRRVRDPSGDSQINHLGGLD